MKADLSKKRVYFDWAAATPLLPEAKAAMEPFLVDNFGNPSAIHQEGAVARRAVDEARDSIAKALGIRESEVFFTASGTESNNLAIYGLLRQLVENNRSFNELEVITTKLEHPSVSQVLKHLQGCGLTVKYVPVDEVGLINTNELTTLLNERTCLVTFAYANSEIGTVQPVGRITRLVAKYNREHKTAIKVHLDAAQAPLWLTCQPHQLGVDLMTLDAGKCQGPKGVGVLVKLSNTDIKPVTLGGGQEVGLRAGTESVAGIVGAAVAIEKAQQDWPERADKVSVVRDEGIKVLLGTIPQAILNGPGGEDRLANNINISIPGLDTEFATVVLDTHGFAVSTKSACSGADGGESAVVKEILNDPARAASTLRITLGPNSNIDDINRLITCLKAHVEKMSQY